RGGGVDGGGGSGGQQRVGAAVPGLLLHHEAAQHLRAAGAEQLDRDPVFLLERVGEFLGGGDRRRRVERHLALAFRRRDVDGLGGGRPHRGGEPKRRRTGEHGSGGECNVVHRPASLFRFPLRRIRGT